MDIVNDILQTPDYIFDKNSKFAGIADESLINITIVAIFAMVILFGNMQMIGLLILLFLIIYLLKLQNKRCEYEKLAEQEFDTLINNADTQSPDIPAWESTTVEQPTATTDQSTTQVAEPVTNSAGFAVDKNNSANELSNVNKLSDTVNYGQMCGGYLDDYMLPESADDRFALCSRKKFVHTTAKRPDIEYWKYMIGAEFEEGEKRDWWGEDDY
jgi:Ca2+/Na+ antiporter